MDTKNVIGTGLIIIGIAALIPGVLSVFEGGQVLGINPWAWIIIGALLFFAGVSLMKSVHPSHTSNTINKVD